MIIHDCGDSLALTVTAYSDGFIRLQAHGYDRPAESLLERYGFLNELPAEPAAQMTGNRFELPGGVALELDGHGGWKLWRDGVKLTATGPDTRIATAPTVHRNQGCQLDLELAPDEKLIGFGDQTRTRFLLNGQKDALWIRYPSKHVPVPFLMSNRGYGIFFNTTRRLCFDVGVTDPAVARFAVAKDFLDIIVIVGASYDELIEKYTRLTGRPALPPLKSFGLWLLFHSRATGHDVLTIAKTLRDEGIPCDNLSLEPAWMQQEYDFSANKEWSAERFRGCGHGSSYRAGPAHLIQALKRMGYDLGLWLCSDWDFTWEEERRRSDAGKSDTAEAGSARLAGLELSHVDETVAHGAVYLDKNTIRDQPWFEHLKKFVTDGVRFFKLDPAVLINEFPDRLYGNGRHDDEMHNMAFMLCSKQMARDFESFTNRRYYGISIAGWAGFQRFPGTWAGDTGGGRQSMTGILQDAIVGHACATCDMNTQEVAGIHMGFLLPWALINSWSYFHYPGYQGDTFNQIFRDYASLRMRLLPYYYSLAYRSTQTGMAIARPLCLVHPEADQAYSELQEFYLGDGLLATVYQDDVMLPPGRWFDFWNGTLITGAWQRQAVPVPANRGGHLLVREGALIPTVPVQLHVGAAEWSTITWLLFPGPRPTSFTLYLDDGDSLGHRQGEYAKVTLTCTPVKDRCELTWGPVEGSQPERLAHLRHAFTILGHDRIAAVDATGTSLTLTPTQNPLGKTTSPVATGQAVAIVLNPTE